MPGIRPNHFINPGIRAEVAWGAQRLPVGSATRKNCVCKAGVGPLVCWPCAGAGLSTTRCVRMPPNVVQLLPRLLASPSRVEATSFVVTACTRGERKALARLAGLEAAWVECNQSIAANVADLAESIVGELYEPFCFYCRSLSCTPRARALFERKKATRPLTFNQRHKFWEAAASSTTAAWLPPPLPTFDAVVHFVQSASGTGVHVGDCLVLTCAHVVDARDDEGLAEGAQPVRLGRQKLVMFASRRVFLSECVAVEETADGSRDVAVLRLGVEVLFGEAGHSGDAAELSAAVVATTQVETGSSLVCIGNPSNIDLESLAMRSIEFEPATWHASVGACEGYEAASTWALRESIASRGRPPTRGELSQVAAAPAVDEAEGVSLRHTCWTYWGHSGAPLFDESGAVCALHSSWDDHSGMRHAQKLEVLGAALQRAGGLVGVAAPASAAPASAASQAAKGHRSKRTASGTADARGGKTRRRAGATSAGTHDDAGAATAGGALGKDVGGEAEEVPLFQRLKARMAAEDAA